jgi:hypothetical protein
VPEVLTLPTTARKSRSMVNAKHSENHSREIVKADCLLLDQCSGYILKPLPGAQFEKLCHVAELDKFVERNRPLISLGEAARRIGCQRKTLYNYIAEGRLTEKEGLRPLGKRWRIDAFVFMESFRNGEIPSCT